MYTVFLEHFDLSLLPLFYNNSCGNSCCTRYFDNIIHHKDYSYNISEEFEDNSIDFIYIDADHTHESVNRDLKLYLPKLKPNGWIGGHDYNKKQWPGVVKAINENIGKPQHIFKDTSWLSKHKTQLL